MTRRMKVAVYRENVYVYGELGQTNIEFNLTAGTYPKNQPIISISSANGGGGGWYDTRPQ